MLFSDIEGSTALLSRLGDRYGEALSAQRAVLRAAICACRGHEMGTEGDSFFVVFESAARRGRAAAWRRSGRWPAMTGPAVSRSGSGWACTRGSRPGTRTGTSGWTCTGRRGSRRPRTAVRWCCPRRRGSWRSLGCLPGLSVRDLGFHRLKDIEAPERIYQLVGPGLQERFPPLKSLGAQTSLPVPATPLVGRDGDLEQAARRARPAGGAAGDAHRPRRCRQDAAGAGGRRIAGPRPSRTASSSSRWRPSAMPR